MAEMEQVICNGSGWLLEAEVPAKPCPGCYNCLRNGWDDSQVAAAREAARGGEHACESVSGVDAWTTLCLSTL